MEQKWQIGQTVEVQSRTWAGINKPGGCAKITKVHMTADGSVIVGLDVKYLVGGGHERQLDPCLCSVFHMLERGGRKRRNRDFLHQKEEDLPRNNPGKRAAGGGKKKNGGPSKKATNSRVDIDDEEEEDEDEIETEAAVDEAAGKKDSQQESQQTSTTFSTPQKKRSRAKPTKVTPIPSLVIADPKNDTVSPMFAADSILGGGTTNNDDDNVEHVKTSTVRRGLFVRSDQEDDDGIKASNIPSNGNGSKLLGGSDTCNNDLDRKAAPKTRKPAPKTSKSAATMAAQKNGSTGASPQRRRGMQQQQMAFDPARGRFHSTATRMPAPSFARSQSARNAAQSSTANSPPAGSRKALKDVYEDELQRAREFMDQMVGPPPPAENSDDASSSRDATATAAVATATSAAKGLKENDGYIRTSTRYDEFLSSFQTLRLRIDEDGTISEAQFKEMFNAMTSEPFDGVELDGHIASLCNEGKLMRSDGMLYLID